MEPTLEELKAELEKAQDQIKKVNAESAGRRKELEKIAAEKAEKDKAALSDAEKLQAEIKAVKAEVTKAKEDHRAVTIRAAIAAEANKLGFANPEDAWTLLDTSGVEMADDGKVTGFEKSLTALAESNRLAMKDDKRSDNLGTPRGKGKPASSTVEQAKPNNRV